MIATFLCYFLYDLYAPDTYSKILAKSEVVSILSSFVMTYLMMRIWVILEMKLVIFLIIECDV